MLKGVSYSPLDRRPPRWQSEELGGGKGVVAETRERRLFDGILQPSFIHPGGGFARIVEQPSTIHNRTPTGFLLPGFILRTSGNQSENACCRHEHVQ